MNTKPTQFTDTNTQDIPGTVLAIAQDAMIGAASEHGKKLGLTEEGALKNVVGNAVSAPSMTVMMYQMDGKKDVLIEQLAEQLRHSKGEKAKALKMPEAAGQIPEARFPDGAIARYNADGRNLINTEIAKNSAGIPVTGNDIEQALIADIKRTAVLSFAKAAGLESELNARIGNTRGAA